MDSKLSDLLNASAAAVVTRTADLQRELDQLVAAAEAATAPSRRRFSRRAGLAGLVTASAIALGVTASAVGGVDTPWSTIAARKFSYPGPSIHADEMSGGRNCKVVFGASDTWDPKHPVNVEERARAREHAKQFVRDLDISTISVSDALIRHEKELAQTAAENPADEVRTTAVLIEIDQRLQAELKARGLSTHAVSAMAMPECEVVIPPPDLDEARP